MLEQPCLALWHQFFRMGTYNGDKSFYWQPPLSAGWMQADPTTPSLEQGGERGLSTLLVIMSLVTHGIDDQDGACTVGPALLYGHQLGAWAE